MKNLVYIGNKLSKTGKTATTIDTLGKGLAGLGYTITYASSYSNIVLRFMDMLWTIFKHRKTVDYVLIDTYSTLNFYYAYSVSKLCQFFKLKYIPILHGGNLPERLKSNPKLSASIFKKSYINISPSDYIKSAFEQLGYSNIKVIPNTITLENYPFKTRALDRLDMLWVRSFSNLYNPKLAIDVLFRLKQKGIDASLTMVGPDNDGSLKSTKDYAQKLEVSVTFTGKLTKTKWIDLSKNCTVFLNTTNFDNTPVSVIEAMALGLPIVSTNVGGLPFLIENKKEGLLVNPNDTEAFVEAIIQFKDNEDFYQSTIKNARLKAETFNWEPIKQKWLSTLK